MANVVNPDGEMGAVRPVGMRQLPFHAPSSIRISTIRTGLGDQQHDIRTLELRLEEGRMGALATGRHSKTFPIKADMQLTEGEA